MLCESAELGLDALDQVWQSAVVAPEVQRWDVFAHSKGAAAAVKLYQRRWSAIKSWPKARIYAVGLPWRMGAQYLPNASDYVPGRIYASHQIVAFTWSDDAVRRIDRCTDLDALFIDEAHDYTPMFAPSVEDDTVQLSIRNDFWAGQERWVGERY